MTDAIALDATPLGRLVHPRLNVEISAWMDAVLEAGVTVYLPGIIDYEVRRGLLAAGMTRSVVRLDEFGEVLEYLPLTASALRDGDVILAAQARQVGAVVITKNVGHLAWFVTARDWRDTPADSLAR